ncbi:MAG: DegT/DnrJ/EryC1/StrS family aminotransferase [Elusimicrobiota bacterium]
MKYELLRSTFTDEERKAMKKVVDSDQFTMGGHVREFEEQFARYFGKKHAVMVNSGSSANLIAVASLFYRKHAPLKPGDEVIVPSISWSTTYYPLHQYGLKMRFVDVDIDTLNIDVEQLEKALTPRTRMVVAVSVLGNPCRFDRITEFCRKHGLILFEDNCESMGATFGGKFTGTFGLINTFSTFFSHHISTMEGGLILTDDKELFNLAKSLRNHGWTRGIDAHSGIFRKKYDDFFEAYRFILPGYNVRPGEMNGVLGKIQLKKLDRFLEIRRKNAQYFKKLFQNDDRFIIQNETRCAESSWFCFTMIVNTKQGVNREKILRRLKNAGIEFRIITGGCILCHDVVKYFKLAGSRCENARFAHYNGFFVGNYPYDIRDKIDYLHKTLKNI